MRVLVGCEFSGIVRDAFARRGHDAWSCDLLPTERPGNHFQQDIFELLEQDHQWDLFIFHWPCTYLCNSGVRWLYRGGHGIERNEARWWAMEENANWFKRLLSWPGISRVCGENPIPHKYAKAIMGQPNQIIQPWQFGHGESKATCLWLRGLPNLKPTNIVDGRYGRCHHTPPSANRWKERSRTYEGVAEAMAEQWGCL